MEMKEKKQPMTVEEWLDYGRQLMRNPGTNNHEKGKWVREQGLDYVPHKVERSNALKLAKMIEEEGVDISDCPYVRPTNILQWLRDIEGENHKKSCVYVLRNPQFPFLLKIGMTTSNLTRRLVGINKGSGVPEDFELIDSRELPEDVVPLVELALHRVFSDYRVNQYREFFAVRPEIVSWVLDEILERMGDLRSEPNSLVADLKGHLNNSYLVGLPDFKLFYERICEVFANIYGCAELNTHAINLLHIESSAEESARARIQDLNKSILELSSCLNGEFFERDGYPQDFEYMSDDWNVTPPSDENSDGQGCVGWSPELWRIKN